MILSRNDVLGRISAGEIVVEPFDESRLGPDTLDVTLSEKLLVSRVTNEVVDSRNPSRFLEPVEMDGKGFILMPGQFVLGSTVERVALPNDVAAQIDGRSSIGRLGIMVHVTAGLVHAGFGKKNPSTITLEIFSVNPNPIRLYPGISIAQLCFMRLSSPTTGYDELKGRYSGQQGPEQTKGV